ncbi:hypothetical protein JTZ62_04535 [Mammaliicoccus sciuri]|uniref:hypothetical protein n=1 Tax=Mammaliicoccus sciuri TaxID=1296 RepID=UPI0019D3E6B3|nr:hypothetical protein [Mammaliicoccus sciuri]QSN68425.1 hypothetical protein JTZ62_04535 [Mammaliicoccus sciuri]UIU23166.1 hypothetical protein LLZ87_04545 [Mammaliicoccus sciuri]UIU26071.1 hypothetical protein LLZ92_04545 [Mammaliicoccus sciuri]
MEKLTIEKVINNVVNKSIDYNDYFEYQNLAYENALQFFVSDKAEDIIEEFLEDCTLEEIQQIFTIGLGKLPKVWNRFDKNTLYDRYELHYCELGYIAIPAP